MVLHNNWLRKLVAECVGDIVAMQAEQLVGMVVNNMIASGHPFRWLHQFEQAWAQDASKWGGIDILKRGVGDTEGQASSFVHTAEDTITIVLENLKHDVGM